MFAALRFRFSPQVACEPNLSLLGQTEKLRVSKCLPG
jgi:hypothetical protein